MKRNLGRPEHAGIFVPALYLLPLPRRAAASLAPEPRTIAPACVAAQRDRPAFCNR